MRVVLGVLSLLLLAAAALAEPDAAVVTATEALEGCIRRNAKRLSSGPDAADIIAKAAPQLCEEEHRKLFLAWGKDKMDLAVRHSDHVEKTAIDRAILDILEIRTILKRK